MPAQNNELTEIIYEGTLSHGGLRALPDMSMLSWAGL